jgi:hypothetical protein
VTDKCQDNAHAQEVANTDRFPRLSGTSFPARKFPDPVFEFSKFSSSTVSLSLFGGKGSLHVLGEVSKRHVNLSMQDWIG